MNRGIKLRIVGQNSANTNTFSNTSTAEQIVRTDDSIIFDIKPAVTETGVPIDLSNFVDASLNGNDLSKMVNIDDSEVNYDNPGIYQVNYQLNFPNGEVLTKNSTITVNGQPMFGEIKVENFDNPAKVDTIKCFVPVNITKVQLINTIQEEASKICDNASVDINYSEIDLTRNGEYEIKVYKSTIDTPKIMGMINLIIGAQETVILGENAEIYATKDAREINWNEGIKVFDINEGDITNRLETDSSRVNIRQAGVYPVSYKVVNQKGETIKADRWIKVVVQAPTINTEPFAVTIGEDYSFVDHVKAFDKIDGDISNRVQINQNEINNDVPGIYDVKYRVINSNDKEATATDKIQIIAPKPSIIANDVTVPASSTSRSREEWLNNVSVSDSSDNQIINSVIVDDSNVNLNKEGTYSIEYQVTNRYGESAITTGNVTVIADPPTLNVAQPDDVTIGDHEFNWAKLATAVDAIDGDLTNKISVDASKVNLNSVGVYPVVYEVRNSNQKVASKTIFINVKEPTTSIDAHDMTLTRNEAMGFDWLNGVHAIDSLDGDISNRMTVFANEVNTNIPGKYNVIYMVRNNSGKQFSKTINVTILN